MHLTCICLFVYKNLILYLAYPTNQTSIPELQEKYNKLTESVHPTYKLLFCLFELILYMTSSYILNLCVKIFTGIRAGDLKNSRKYDSGLSCC